MIQLTAETFAVRLQELISPENQHGYECYFNLEKAKQPGQSYSFGVRMGDIFKLGKEYAELPLHDIERLMDSPIYEFRTGAMSIMGQYAKGKSCRPERLAGLYNLYIRRHDRINDWGLVDLAAYYVVGKHLADKPRAILYKLAQSDDEWERRSAIVATAHFILKLK